MRTTLTRSSFLLCGALAFSSACGSAETPPTGPEVAISISALTLSGVADACWSITVENGDAPADTVWSRVISSSQYGDGGGSATYVGPCDASPGVADNVVTLELLGIYGTTVADCSAPPTSLAFQNPGPMTKSVVCSPDADTLVQFDVTIARPANQGFFDIAVNFGDIFCSAKVDCCVDDDHDGTCDRDLTLLHDATGERASTVVVGFACASGNASTDTFLYRTDLEVVCDGNVVATIDPNGEGNLCQPAGGPCTGVTDPGGLLYQVAVYRGKEALTNVDKVYWNLALGVNKASFPAGQTCSLRARATADDNNEDGSVPGQLAGAQGGAIAAGDVYPIVDFDVTLSDPESGAWACTKHPIDGPNGGTTTTYTVPPGPNPPFPHCYDPEGLCGSNPPPCACTIPGTSTCDPSGAACLPCLNYTEDFSTDPRVDGWVLIDGDTNDTTTRWVATDGGFFRLTEELQGERGVLYHPSQTIPAGDSTIKFDFRITDNGGAFGSADGLAFTIVNTASGALPTLIEGTQPGGGIGYHNPDAILNGDAVSALTIEIDTFDNDGEGDDHIAVHRDLDSSAAGRIAQVATPGVVDGLWHTVEVRIIGGNVEIHMDGTLRLTTSANGFNFAGGYMFFSSSTGFEADVHEIDSVIIDAGCDQVAACENPLTTFSDDFTGDVARAEWTFPVLPGENQSFPFTVADAQACCSIDSCVAEVPCIATTDWTGQLDFTASAADGTFATFFFAEGSIFGPGEGYLVGVWRGSPDQSVATLLINRKSDNAFLDQIPVTLAPGVTHTLSVTVTLDNGAGGSTLTATVGADTVSADVPLFAPTHVGVAFDAGSGQTCIDNVGLSQPLQPN